MKNTDDNSTNSSIVESLVQLLIHSSIISTLRAWNRSMSIFDLILCYINQGKSIFAN